MKPILFVSATRISESKIDSNSCIKTNLSFHKETTNNIDDYHIFYDNSKGLCEIYNTIFNEKWKDYIVIFAHDDIIINDICLKKKLNTAIKEFDVVGLAGSASHSLNKPVLWHNSPRAAWSGAVEHPLDEEHTKFNFTHFGQWPKQVMTLDGLFLAVNMEKALEKGLRFDPIFDFHFYDLDFSVTANNLGLKCGTWNIPVTHFSHGDYKNSSWEKNQELYINKWKK